MFISAELIRQEEHRARRCNLIARCIRASTCSTEIDGKQVVLRDNKLYIDRITSDDSPFGHPFAGYYLPYPDEKFEGLVSTITDEAPILNWIYVDNMTYEVKYGVRVDAQPNFHGPFDCTRQDHRMTLVDGKDFVRLKSLMGYGLCTLIAMTTDCGTEPYQGRGCWRSCSLGSK